MKLSDGLTPYPILRTYTDDFVDSTFNANINYQILFQELKIDVKFNLSNEEMINDITQKKLCYAVHIECPVSKFREVYQTYNDNITITIPINLITEKIEIGTLVVANSDYEYSNKNFHSDYKDIIFQLNKGNIIADWGIELLINEDDNNLDYLPSVIKIEFVDAMDVTLGVITDDNDILIQIDKKYKEIYTGLGKSLYKKTMLSLIILPVMEMVLLRMKENKEENEGKHWFESLSKIFEENNIDINDLNFLDNSKNSILYIAQKIFRNPIEASFNELDTLAKRQG